MIQQRVYQTKVQDVNDLMQRLYCVVGWSRTDDAMTSGADVSIAAFEPQEDILNIHYITNFSQNV